jgi:hypothetical protein
VDTRKGGIYEARIMKPAEIFLRSGEGGKRENH